MSFLLEHDGHVALELLRATFDVVLLVDAALQVVAVEGDPSPLFGDTAAALCGASLRELFPHVELAVVQHRIRAGGGTWRFGASSDRVLARGAARGPVPVEGLIQRLPGPPPRAVIALRDARASARFHDAHGRALRDQRVLRVVHRALTDEGDEPTVLAEVCRALVGEAGYPFTWIGFREHDPDRTLRPVAHAGSSPIFSAGPPVSWADDERGRGPAGTAARTGVTTVVDQILAHPAAEPWRGYFQQRGIGSALGLPIRVDGEVVGALSFHAREPAAFPPHEVELLEEVADAVGRALTSRRAITARRRAEDRMAEVLDALGVATWTVSDVEQRVTWVSDAAPRLFGFPRSSLLTMPNLLAVVHPEDCAHVESLYADLLREGHVEFEVRPLRAPERWVHAIIRLIRGEAGRVLGREGVAFDVTERRRAEEALRSLNTDLEGRVAERTAALHDLYDNAPCGYYTSDVARRLLGANATLLRWLGYAREEVVGRPVFDFLSPESAAALRAELAHAPEGPPTGVWHDVERELVRRDGSTFWVQADGAVRRDAEGRVVEVRATLSDITLRRQAEARLREQEARLQEALREAQQAARAKDDFLASMSHELRTPLNGVLGLGEALLEGVYGPMSAPQRTALTRARESGEHLLSLINDILDVAKVESGKLALELAPVQLDELVRESLQLVQESARRKGINVELGLSAGDEPLLLDARRLRQVLVNLLSNAVKFTPEGGLVGLEVEESASTLAITVWDRGLGIAAEDLPRLFQPFVQLDSRLSRAHTGTGLGLTLVRRLVALHGGEVSVESELGRGSRFTIELPVRRPALDAPATPTKTPSLAVRRLEGHGAGPLVLVAEDDETNATLVRDVLAAAGYRVERARDGAQAVEMARSLRPDAILMDVQMPVMDGLGATRAIRAEDDPALRAVPILAVTALAMPGDEARCRSAGADAYLTKPVGHKRLLEALEAHLPGAGASGSSPPTAPTTR